MKSSLYQPRTYRNWVDGNDLIGFTVVEQETDLFIRATSNLQKKARRLVLKYRGQIEQYARNSYEFLTSLVPVEVPKNSPRIVREMGEASRKAGVGPMAAVAGAIAEYVGRELLPLSSEVIVENGGDIFMKVDRKRVIGIFAGGFP
ncbi:MAG: UPF0280 family protein, partial [Dehalococcoidales bacterium]|nr:UPF0280 family protein [Dehalococcoidales bacterium]